MHLDSDELLARIRRDAPDVYELCSLRLLVEVQQAEIERLQQAAVTPSTGFATFGRDVDEGGRHV